MLPEQNKFSPGKISLYFVFTFFIALTFCSSHIPFFWDGDLLSREAHFYYDNNFSGLILPPGLDRDGTPLLFAMYLAAVWKIIGKTLLISHIALLPVLLGIAWEYFKLAKRFLSEKTIPFAMLLLLFEPTFITQSIIMGYDLALPYFFLLALNALLSDKRILYGIAIALMGLCSVRGIMLGITLLLIDVLMRIMIEKRISVKALAIYVLPFVVLGGFSLWHYHKTGWFFISSAPEYISHRAIVSFNMMIRQGIYVVWQIADFGRAFILVFVTGVFGYAYLKKIKLTEPSKRVLIITTASIVMHVVFFCPFSNPIAHRYFLNIIVLLPLVLCFVLQKINFSRKVFLPMYLFFCVGLLTGNFWIYGGGLSNGWDSSLKSLPYFKLRSEMMDYVKKEKINPQEIASRFPLYQGTYYNNLSGNNFEYSVLWLSEPEKFRYILLSNISNGFTVREKEKLNSSWTGIKEMHAGQVYLKLLKNPQWE